MQTKDRMAEGCPLMGLADCKWHRHITPCNRPLPNHPPQTWPRPNG